MTGSAQPQASAPAPQRALALDALRGLAILAMCLSGRVGGIEGLPTWMRHAQYPRGWHYDASVAGFTWVDLVFPAFLFAMGAAFPLAMSSRLDAGVPRRRVLLGALGRALALVFFGVYVDNVQPWKMGGDPLRSIFGSDLAGDALKSPTTQTWLAALLAFALLFPVFARLPKQWSRTSVAAVRAAGILGCFGLLQALRFPDGSHWSVRRFDVIIMVLANMAFFGAGAWMFTRKNPMARLLMLPFVFALLESAKVEGSWMQWIARSSIDAGGTRIDVSWAWNFAWLKYLFIVVPGSIVGDMLLAWMRSPSPHPPGGWTRAKLVSLSLAVLGLVAFVHVGLQTRGNWLPITSAMAMALGACAWFFVRDASSPAEAFLRDLFRFSMAALLLGLACEPLGGGIHKDPATASYFFVGTGLSGLLLFSLTIWIDVLGLRRPFALLVMNGQNPMIAYVGIRNLLSPVVDLRILPWKGSWSGLRAIAMELLKAPWLQAAWGMFETLALGLATAAFTKLKVLWRT